MLSAHEFTVGTLADAGPLSLILPQRTYDEVILVSKEQEGANAVILSSGLFVCLKSRENYNRSGIIIGNVRIEVDEQRCFDTYSGVPVPGAIVRLKSEIAIAARWTENRVASTFVTLYDGLPPVENLKAGFRRWQVVIGEGQDKRVLWRFPEDCEKKYGAAP